MFLNSNGRHWDIWDLYFACFLFLLEHPLFLFCCVLHFNVAHLILCIVIMFQKNWNLFSVNVAMAGTGLYQLSRKIRFVMKLIRVFPFVVWCLRKVRRHGLCRSSLQERLLCRWERGCRITGRIVTNGLINWKPRCLKFTACRRDVPFHLRQEPIVSFHVRIGLCRSVAPMNRALWKFTQTSKYLFMHCAKKHANTSTDPLYFVLPFSRSLLDHCY